MQILPLTKYPDPILEKPSHEIAEITPDLHQLSSSMIATMIANDGIGLAGPQVHQPRRIIIVQGGKAAHTFINPRIINKSKETSVQEEGCLSLPGIFIPITRSDQIDVECQTLEGKTVRMHAEGLIARIFQHEIDHIDGILIIRRVNILHRWRIRKQLKELKRKHHTK